MEKGEGTANSDGGGRKFVPVTALDAVRKVDGVAEVQPNVVRADYNAVSVLGKDGKALSTDGAPLIGGNWVDSPTLNQQRIISGRAPTGPGEVLFDPRLAEKAGTKVGDRAVVFAPAGQQDVRVVGLVRYANGKDSLGGEAYVLFTTPVAQQVLKVDGYSDLLVAARGRGRPAGAARPGRGRDPGRHRGDHRQPARGRAGQRHPGGPRLPEHLPAGLRRGRAVRRRLHHLQHVLDPGRAAHPGAGADARARREQGPGDPLGADRGRGRRRPGVRDRAGRRDRRRTRPAGAVRRLRRRPAVRADRARSRGRSSSPSRSASWSPRSRRCCRRGGRRRWRRSRRCGTRRRRTARSPARRSRARSCWSPVPRR